MGVLGIALMVISAPAPEAHERKSPAASAGARASINIGHPFALTGYDGRRTTAKDFPGKYLLIYFGYTSCTDQCPLDLAIIADALDRLGAVSERLQPLFITVDPRRDTAAILKKYLPRFHDRIIGLTGSDTEIKAVLRNYRIKRRKMYSPDSTGPNNYVMDHSAVTYLLGPDGSFRHEFLVGVTAAQMTAEIRKHLK